jgi:oxygen-dependent protoporphyrinogen oxidase
MKALWRDWQMPKRQEEDESIQAFFTRRLGQTWTERFVDPLVSGIYAGDCHQLSLKSCFPLFDEWEQQRGSLLGGAWHQAKSPDGRSAFIQKMQHFPLFSFKEGMETLPRALADQLTDCLHLEKAVCQLNFHSKGVEIQLEKGGRIQADHVISTVSPAILSHWLPAYPQFAMQLKALRYATVVVVNLGFKQDILPFKGFGYLVPSQEKSSILGCVWDSCVFPQQSEGVEQTRFTVMMGGMQHPEVENLTDQNMQDQVLEALEEQMGMRVQPQVVHIKRAQQAIPQYEVGYQVWKHSLLQEGQRLSSAFTLSGSALTGVAVNDCIAYAYSLAEKIKKSL